MNIRKSYVSGKFYPDNKIELENLLNNILKIELERNKTFEIESKTRILGGVVPHAGYMYSGYEAVHFFNLLKNIDAQYDTIVILNPNHTGYGADISLDPSDAWETPLGLVKMDKWINEYLNKNGIVYSEEAHKFEHSGEVIVPMLQKFLNYEFEIVPITIKAQTYNNAVLIAGLLANIEKVLKKKILVLASSDFSHYVSPEKALEMDKKAMGLISRFETKEFIHLAQGIDYSICGYGPIGCLLEYSKLLSESAKITLLRYGNSGEIRPSNEVVSYASFILTEK